MCVRCFVITTSIGMKTLYFSFFSFLLFFFTGTTSAIKLTKSKANNNEIKKEKIPQLNSDLLPPLEDLLNELDLIHRKSALIKMGVTETRYLLRLKNMDYQMMVSMECIVHSIYELSSRFISF